MSCYTGKTTWDNLDFADFSFFSPYFDGVFSNSSLNVRGIYWGEVFFIDPFEQIQGKPGETVKEQFSRQIPKGQKFELFESWTSWGWVAGSTLASARGGACLSPPE